jgi:hypothetical protein
VSHFHECSETHLSDIPKCSFDAFITNLHTNVDKLIEEEDVGLLGVDKGVEDKGVEVVCEVVLFPIKKGPGSKRSLVEDE